jgi:hypothetical protein
MTIIVVYSARLEPIPRSQDFKRGLRAEIADPLWFLTRQWQMGEFIGHDGGSIAHGEIKWSSAQLAAYSKHSRAEPQDIVTSFKNDSPLEVSVEKEKVNPSLRLRVQMGQNFERILLKAAFEEYINTFRTAYPLDPPSSLPLPSSEDRGAKRYFDFMIRRVMDGYKFKKALDLSLASSSPEIPSSVLLSINSRDRQAILEIIQKFYKWSSTLCVEPRENDANCWVKERLEYDFAVSAPSFDGNGGVVLVAPEYSEGSLDWYSFSVDPDSARLDPELQINAQAHVSTFLPTNVTFKGMPNKRWWDFEDATISFGAIEADKRDVAKMIVMDFALVSGNDWFMIPLPLEIGSLARINSLIVTDVFGERLLIKSSCENDFPEGEKGWTMFKLSYLTASGQPYRVSDFLFLPPSLGPSVIEGPEIEKVNFIRDEMANMAWAIEQKYESELGDATSGYESDVASTITRIGEESRAGEEGEVAESIKLAKIKYLLQTRVPKNWIPFLPVHVSGTNRAVDLQLGQMLKYEPGTVDPKPKSVLLQQQEDGNKAYKIKEEEIPRAGIFVTRRFQRARWIDGSTYLWIGRQKKTGHGEGSSGLRFDIVEDK